MLHPLFCEVIFYVRQENFKSAHKAYRLSDRELFSMAILRIAWH